MVNLGKPNVDPSSEQDMSETSTLPDTQDVYEHVPPEIRDAPINYLQVSKKGVDIEGQYFIDLSIPPPAPHIVSGAKNLSLYTTSGAVIADVWVTGNNRLKRVSLKLCSDNGSLCGDVHDIFSDGVSETRPSLDIELWANYGDVALSLPRDFRGPMTIRSSHERVDFTPELKQRTALVSDVQGVRVFFVGYRPRSGRWRSDVDKEGERDAGGPPEEPLDKLSVGGRHTGVRIHWDGEAVLPQRKQKTNSWEDFCMGTERFFTSGRVDDH